MSGGHWDYSGWKIDEMLSTIGKDPEVVRRWPGIAEAYCRLGAILCAAEHDMDWALSGDTSIEDDHEFDSQFLGKLALAASIEPSLTIQKLDDLEKRIHRMRADLSGTSQSTSLAVCECGHTIDEHSRALRCYECDCRKWVEKTTGGQ